MGYSDPLKTWLGILRTQISPNLDTNFWTNKSNSQATSMWFFKRTDDIVNMLSPFFLSAHFYQIGFDLFFSKCLPACRPHFLLPSLFSSFPFSLYFLPSSCILFAPFSPLLIPTFQSICPPILFSHSVHESKSAKIVEISRNAKHSCLQ